MQASSEVGEDEISAIKVGTKKGSCWGTDLRHITLDAVTLVSVHKDQGQKGKGILLNGRYIVVGKNCISTDLSHFESGPRYK